MRNVLIAFAIVVSFISGSMAQTAPPRIFYSDLTSGPNTGGQNNAGAFVTLYGSGFGNIRGTSTVTIGGVKASNYPIWSNTKVTFQLGSAAKSGNVVVNLLGAVSNSVPFSVAAGKIYFVSRSGSATGAGTYASPWSSLRAAKNKMAAGDIVYVEDGVAVTNTESSDASLVLSSVGTASAPKAMIAYPGSTVTIGSSTGARTGIQITSGYWVLGGLTIRGAESGVTLTNVNGARVSSSDISCPNGMGTGGCVSTTGSSALAFLGNDIHDNGSASSANVGSYDSMSFTGSSSVEVGWNQVANTRGCNAIAFHSDATPSNTISIHDNYIHDARCEAISLGPVDPSVGAVSLYNNVISKSGTGPAPEGMAAGGGYAAIAVSGGSPTPVQAYNNTIYQAGAIGGAEAGAVRASGAVELTNNIVYLASGEQYVSLDTNLNWVSGSKNVFYGAGNPPAIFMDSVVADPELVSPSGGDFHPLASSPAISAGATTPLATDIQGVLTPQNSVITIGAYEYSPKRTQGGILTGSLTSLAFGNINVGQSATATTVVSNTGLRAVSLTQANSNNSQFVASGMTFPLTLNPGKSAVLTVTYTPSSSGTQSGTVSLASNAANSPLNIKVGGSGVATGTATLQASTSSLSMGSVTVGSSTTQSVTIKNTGTASATISALTSSNYAFSTSGLAVPVTIAGGGSATFTAVFTPSNASYFTGTLAIQSNATNSTLSINWSGTGTTAASGTATLQTSTTTLAMGSVAVGSSSTQSVTISNTGTASATISALTSSNAAFSTSGLAAPVTIAGGGSATFTAVFTPTSASSFSGTLTVQSNATNPTISINWSGTGTSTAVSHSSSLSWSSGSTSAVGYNVYRSTQSGTGYTKVTTSPIATTSYTDSTVSAGLTYYYVATELDSSGDESAYSSQVTAVIPTP
jgi:hypothetical protein